MVSLLDSLRVKDVVLKNRIVMPPMQSNRATQDGGVTDALVDYYTDRVSAVGMVIVEHSYIVLNGQSTDRQLGIYDDKLIPGLSKLAEKIHAKGTPAIIQLNHVGAKASRDLIIQPVAPSDTETARSLSLGEIELIAYAFARAADRAIKAGFDGVEIHGAHGFLLNQFYSPLANKRKDEYGGSLKNRMRFPLEVIEKVRNHVEDGLLLYRLGADDFQKDGTTIDDSKIFAKELEAAGVDILDVSGGVIGDAPPQLKSKQGYFIPQAHQIKQSVNLPVIGVGGIKEAEVANRFIQEEQVDLIAVGRQLLQNPLWAKQAINKLTKAGSE